MKEIFSTASLADLDAHPIREQSVASMAGLSLPSTEDEQWRYSTLRDVLTASYQPQTSMPKVMAGKNDELVANPAATITIVNGWVLEIAIDAAWEAKGLSVSKEIAGRSQDSWAEDIFDYAHQAYTPQTLTITIAKGLAVEEPIVINNYHNGDAVASFPSIKVDAREASHVSIVERQSSSVSAALSVNVTAFDVAEAAVVKYLAVQNNGPEHIQLARIFGTVASQANLNVGLASFGGSYSRTRSDIRLAGRGATGDLNAAYYGDRHQVHDFRTYQHHDDRDTQSNMLFKGVVDDTAGSIYTGLIHIHPEGAGSNAFQTNRNIKLSDDAWTWSVPNLEIENNEVHCSHASTVNPVDDAQRFYLESRGVPPLEADQLIVAGFYDEVLQKLPVPQAHGAIASFVDQKLAARRREAAEG